MFGFLLAIASSLLSESSLSIGKKEMNNKKEDIFSFIFLGLFFNFIIFLCLALIKPNGFIFSLNSLPTFGWRLILEIIQVYLAAAGIALADRTTYGITRVISIPLLLMVDVFLGYTLNLNQIIGIGILITGMIIALTDKTVNKKGLPILILSALNAVITISLYKYNITHFNSFVGEQLIMSGGLLLLVTSYIIFKEKNNPFKMLLKKKLFSQSFLEGAAGVVASLAYTFLPASVILAITRAASVFWATIFGKFYFKEKNILHKAVIVLIIIIGFMFLIK